MKFDQLIEHPKKEIFFFKNYAENETVKLVRDRFFLKKSLILGKSKWSAAWFHYIWIALKLAYNRNKLFKTLHYCSRDMLNFDFLDKGLGITSPAHFVYGFSTEMFFMLYSTNWPNFIAWLLLLLEILGIMCIATVCYPVSDVMDFEINFFFLIEPFFLHDQKVVTKT